MFKKLTFIMIMLTTWGGGVSAQSIYADIASEMAKEGINQAEAKLNQLPNMLEEGLDIATSEREFESNEFCLGNVQALVNMGDITANIMPLTKVWTYEDNRGPVGKLRIMPVSYTHLRAHETKANLVCRLLLEKKKKK